MRNMPETEIRFLWKTARKEEKNYWNDELPQNKFKTKIRSSAKREGSKRGWPASQNPARTRQAI